MLRLEKCSTVVINTTFFGVNFLSALWLRLSGLWLWLCFSWTAYQNDVLGRTRLCGDHSARFSLQAWRDYTPTSAVNQVGERKRCGCKHKKNQPTAGFLARARWFSGASRGGARPSGTPLRFRVLTSYLQKTKRERRSRCIPCLTLFLAWFQNVPPKILLFS